jgi:hypothetical protein
LRIEHEEQTHNRKEYNDGLERDEEAREKEDIDEVNVLVAN